MSQNREKGQMKLLKFLKNFIDTQRKRYDDECQRKEGMHNEHMEIFGAFLEFLKKRSQ